MRDLGMNPYIAYGNMWIKVSDDTSELGETTNDGLAAG